MRFLCGVLAVVSLLGCGAKEPMVVVKPLSPPTIETVAVPLVDAFADAGANVAVTGMPTGLGVLQGGVVLVSAVGISRFNAGLWAPMPVGTVTAPQSLGSVQAIAPRASGGLFVLGTEGLFHDNGGRLLKSPISDALAAGSVSAFDSVGSGTTEGLWFVTSEGGFVWANETLRPVSVRFDRFPTADKPTKLIGLSQTKALYAAAGQVFVVDTAAGQATWAAADVGPVGDFARLADGRVFAIITGGLLEVSAEGALKRLTLVEPVVAVAAGAEGLLVGLARGVGVLAAGTVSVRTPMSGLQTQGLVADGQGEVWALGAQGLRRTRAPVPPAVSWLASIKPVYAKYKCDDCHAYGMAIAPTLMTDESYSKANAQLILNRMRSTDTFTRMPQNSTAPVRANDLALFEGWIAGGFKP
jgi:hypothetical protein